MTMPELEPRDEPPRWWKIVAGLLVFAFAVAVWSYVEWRSAPPPPPALTAPLP
jgi:hypothetical protein